MKKLLFIVAGFVLAVAVFGVAGLVYAQTTDDPAAPCPYCGTGEGYGMRGGRGGAGMTGFSEDGEYGPLHDVILAAFAEALGLTPEELEARRQAGETIWQIAEAQGLTLAEFRAMQFDVRYAALDAAVAEGLIEQGQADWMRSRLEYRQEEGLGPGSGMGFGTRQGGRGGWRSGSGNQ